jgi:CRISPR type III-A-associated protein Csm2
MNIVVPQFLDEDDHIRPELLDGDALEIAKAFKSANLTTHQVRKFYDEVKRYQGRLDKPGESYKKIKPLILMLKSKAKYAATKKSNMEVFYEFIEKSINQIKYTEREEIEKKKFDAFCLFFEAIYGFAELKEK